MSVAFTCQCCGIIGTFGDPEEAFERGWDTPPHFSGPITCQLCPSSYLVLGQADKHAEVHARWEREGRPQDFSVETCIPADEQARAREGIAKVTELFRELGLDKYEGTTEGGDR